MKLLLLAISCFFVFACADSRKGSNTVNPLPTKSQGGVDVGNKTSQIPATNVYITHPVTWPAHVTKRSAAATIIETNKLVISNSIGSTIEASRTYLDLASPTPFSLEKYLEAKFKTENRNYEYFEVNGLKGVRANIVDTDSEKVSDIYLISELNEIIHIKSTLKNDGNDFVTGESIISSARLKYKGVAISNSQVKQITMSYSKSTYSFLDESFCIEMKAYCQSPYLIYSSPKTYIKNDPHKLALNSDNGQTGRFVKLGNSSEISFDSIQIQGEYLIAPTMSFLIEDIYSTFSPKNQKKENLEVIPEIGDIFLIRTVDWPKEDLITKAQIIEITSAGTITISYQKLIYVPAQDLNANIDEMNKNTILNDVERSEGEVVLYNEDTWKNKDFSRFNFKFSSTGNRFITNGSWDFNFHGCGDGKAAYLDIGNGMGKVVDFGFKDIANIAKSDFPNLKKYSTSQCNVRIEKDKTYGVFLHKGGSNHGSTYGAVNVLEIGENNSWVRLKFRRISIGSTEHYQTWIEKSDAMKENQVFTQSPDYDYADENFNFMLLKFSREPNLNISLNGELCDYVNECGVLNLGRDINFNDITLEEIISKKGKFLYKSTVEEGDVIAVWREDHIIKTIAVIRIDEITKEKSVQFQQRFLYEALADYQDED